MRVSSSISKPMTDENLTALIILSPSLSEISSFRVSDASDHAGFYVRRASKIIYYTFLSVKGDRIHGKISPCRNLPHTTGETDAVRTPAVAVAGLNSESGNLKSPSVYYNRNRSVSYTCIYSLLAAEYLLYLFRSAAEVVIS